VSIQEADSSVTLIVSPDGLTGTRTLAENGVATITWIDTDTWMISGSGLT
jgi:hypothetical protein